MLPSVCKDMTVTRNRVPEEFFTPPLNLPIRLWNCSILLSMLVQARQTQLMEWYPISSSWKHTRILWQSSPATQDQTSLQKEECVSVGSHLHSLHTKQSKHTSSFAVLCDSSTYILQWIILDLILMSAGTQLLQNYKFTSNTMNLESNEPDSAGQFGQNYFSFTYG